MKARFDLNKTLQAVVVAALLFITTTASARAEIIKVSSPCSALTSIDPVCSPVATLERTGLRVSLVVRDLSRATGMVHGGTLIIPLAGRGASPVDVLYSTVYKPGSVLVLDAARAVHEFPIAFDADTHQPFLSNDISTSGPYGDADCGTATCLAECPNHDDPENPFLGIGGSVGHLIVIHPHIDPICPPVAPGPITDLIAVPQQGYFAFAALSCGQVYGLAPSANRRTNTLSLALLSGSRTRGHLHLPTWPRRR